MARFKILYLLLLSWILYTSCEEAEDRILKPPDKTLLEKSVSYQKEEPGFLSKVKNWIFPSTQDSVPAETQHVPQTYLPQEYGAPKYLPPSAHQKDSALCDSCNIIPWMPVTTNLKHHTVINFVPSKPIPFIYGVPTNEHQAPLVPQTQYGFPQHKPKSPSAQFSLPSLSGYNPTRLPSTYFNPQELSTSQQAPQPQALSQYALYGVPQKQNIHSIPAEYSRPSSLPVQHKSPSSQYGLPTSLIPQKYGFPLQQPTNKYRPLQPQQSFGTPKFKPKQRNQNHIKFLRPPPVSPVNIDVPIGMLPPPLPGSLTTIPTTNTYLIPPAALPSDSYGNILRGVSSEGQLSPSYSPPIEQLSLGSEFQEPIPFPNLNYKPVLPLHNPQNFYSNFKYPETDVQVIPSLKVADFISSVEHPINLIQSPILEITVTPPPLRGTDTPYNDGTNLNTNPIVVDDTYTAASAVNLTFQKNDQQYNFTQPPIDYSNWEPSEPGLILPASQTPASWAQPSSTTVKPKQIQIIVPYTNNNNNIKLYPSKPYTTLLPHYMPPSSTEEVWSKFLENFKLVDTKKQEAAAFQPVVSTPVYNIQDLLKGTNEYLQSQKDPRLPFDVISLQNNIDDWTQQEYRDSKTSLEHKTSKKIPEKYFATTTDFPNSGFDHEQAGSSKKETKLDGEIDTNLIFQESTTTEFPTTTSEWETAGTIALTSTKEKVYIVTPQPVGGTTISAPVTETTPSPIVKSFSLPPKVHNGENLTVAPNAKFLIRVDPEDEENREKPHGYAGQVTVVYSEWPHLINNLQTTTTHRPPISKHPLLGLMDVFAYTPPQNTTVQTISGHSRVVSGVTPATIGEVQKKNTA